MFRLRQFRGHLPATYQTVRIPNFVAEIPPLLHLRLIKQNIIASRTAQKHTQTHPVSTILLHKFNRIRRIAERLRHLPPEFISYNTGKIDIFKRNLTAKLVAGHNHPRHPEEKNLRGGNQIICRIIISKVLIRLFIRKTGFFGIKYRNRPQPGRKPSIEHILISFQVGCRNRRI